MADDTQTQDGISMKEVFDRAEDMPAQHGGSMGGLMPVEEAEDDQGPQDMPTPSSEGEKVEAEEPDEDTPAEHDGNDEPEQTQAAEGDDQDDADEPENEDIPSVHEAHAEAIKDHFPDKDLSDPAEYSKAIEQLAQDRQTLAQERDANERLTNLFSDSQEMVALARRMDEGDSFMEALASTVNIPEAMDELEDENPDEYKKVMKAQAKHELEQEQAAKERQKMEQEFADNQEHSKENIDTFQAEHDMDNEAKEAFLNSVGDHFQDIVRGKVTPDFLSLMRRGLHYETDLEQAREDGRIKGRNETIEKEKSKKNGDTLPAMRGGGKPTDTDAKRETDIFQEALKPQQPISQL